MDSENIRQLLEKYWNCETSLEEEKELRNYFSGQEIPDNLKETATLFRFFEEESQKSLGESFDKEATRRMKARPQAKVISMVRFVQMARIAAGILVVVAATFFVRQEIKKTYPAEVVDTYSDPKLALEETKKALMLISKSFGKAKEGAGKINLFNEAEKKIQGKEKDETEEKINI